MSDSKAPIPPLLLVGCGRMGQAMLAGWNKDGLAPSWIVDPETELPKASQHRIARSAGDVPATFQPAAVILAIKPQVAEQAMRALSARIGNAVVLSIMAGRTLSGLREALPNAGGLVRAMPNTPAAIGRGVSVAVADRNTSASHRALCDRLLRAAGTVEWVEDEAQLDAVTAVSGSGPAYVFLLAELLEKAAMTQGLPPSLARTLARETVAGAGALLAAWPDQDAATLRRNVTSPNGTTQAALEVLMREENWPDATEKAIDAATRRSRELAS
ncbi:pyrroline-5-carboxylate reductase [Acetobacteraceae bacterium KSS8]|uniref:Pyrroline-5-carboxylate reductase n=1 Tax=Endosaccharibacter trunci TaxID=2812733 RepID=A0ABT1W9X7_9PROT|nr:pyrroline-5-carboxylate reductase [Acetobacteraceae bacterium KSS8]